MRPLVFVHAADLHLDSPFAGLSDVAPAIAEILRQATFDAFGRIVELCLAEQSEFLVVAGDVYDGADRGLRAQLAFRDGLQRLARAGIRSFVVHGNHDPLDGWTSSIEFPPETTVFGPQSRVVPVTRDGRPVARVIGWSYPAASVSENPAPHFRHPNPDNLFTVGVLHASVSSGSGHVRYAPTTVGDLMGTGVDYFALGHIHQPGFLNESPPIVYSGNPQGRSVRECGPRGCYVVRVHGHDRIETAFHPMDSVRWFVEPVDLEGAGSIDDVLGGCEKKLSAMLASAEGRHVVARLRLQGRTPLHRELHRPGTAEDLTNRLRESFASPRPFIWTDKLILETRSETSLESRSEMDDLLGLALRLGKRHAAHPASLREVLAPLFEHHQARRLLGDLDDQRIAVLVEQARWRLADLLERDE